MNLFQIVLVVMAVLIMAIWAGIISVEVDKLKNKKEEILVRDKMVSEHEKQKISDEEFITFLKGLKYMDKIYTTDQGTILNSKPHTFKDFVNNQKLPSKSELTWEILADNNLKISDIIKLIESNAPYPMNTKVGVSIDYLKVTSQQTKMIQTLNMYNDPIKIDDNYPLYIKFTDMKNYYDEEITVMYQAGDKYDDKNLDRGAPTKPTKY
jgi:phospholipase C